MKITTLEKKMLLSIPESDYNSGFDPINPDVADMSTWTWDVVETNEQKGTVSSLSKKGLVKIQDAGTADSVIYFTNVGFEKWLEIR